jgi:ZIP family zinc transporter
MAVTDVWAATVYGLLSGVAGTGAGGLLACLLPGKRKRGIGFILEYSAGLMLAIVCFELLPQSFASAPLKVVLAGLMAGVAVMMFSESLIRRRRGRPGDRTQVRHTGMAIALGIAIHNFLEGMAVGSGFSAGSAIGFSIAAAIMLHDVPEGVSIAIPLREGGTSRGKALLWTLAAGLPMGFGALFGAWVSALSPFFIASCLSIAGVR